MIGRWANPRGTLAVQTGRCADGALCGQIVWATAYLRLGRLDELQHQLLAGKQS